MRQSDDGDFSALANIIADGLQENNEKLYRLALLKQVDPRKDRRRWGRGGR
jgi:hypothetical protein